MLAQRRQELDGNRIRFRMRTAFFGDFAREMVLFDRESRFLAILATWRESGMRPTQGSPIR